jgi:hypothetical protein
MTNDPERFNIHHPDLCPALRWKGQFVLAERDPSVPPTNDGLFWCALTQTCIGPDSALAEPGNCSSSLRTCHRGAK